MISSTEKKRAESIGTLKAAHFLLSSDKAVMAAAVASLDAIISTISAPYGELRGLGGLCCADCGRFFGVLIGALAIVCGSPLL